MSDSPLPSLWRVFALGLFLSGLFFGLTELLLVAAPGGAR